MIIHSLGEAMKKCIPFLAALTMSVAVFSAQASSGILRPKIQISAGDHIQGGMYKVLVYGMDHELTFSTQGELDPALRSLHGNKVDFYFGAIAPGGEWISWMYQDGNLTMAPGLSAILRDHDYSADEKSSSQLNIRVRYQFMGTEPKGMYTLFLLIVPKDKDPTNPLNWYGVGMSPLFLE
jgi:hypothetical protein